jgi:hypothetical protein
MKPSSEKPQRRWGGNHPGAFRYGVWANQPMARVLGRVWVEEGPRLVRVVIRAPRRGAQAFLWGVTLFAWAVVEAMLATMVLGVLLARLGQGEPLLPPDELRFLTTILPVWIVLGSILIARFGWELTGREELLVTPEEIVLRRIVLGIRFRRRVSREARVTLAPSSPLRDLLAAFGILCDLLLIAAFWEGALIVEGGGRRARLGRDLGPAQAAVLLAVIRRRFPGLAPVD